MSQKQVKRLRRIWRKASRPEREDVDRGRFIRFVEGALHIEHQRYHRMIRRTLGWFRNRRAG